LHKEGIIHPSLESLAMLNPIEESTNKLYCKPPAGRIQGVDDEIPSDDTPLIEGLRKRKKKTLL